LIILLSISDAIFSHNKHYGALSYSDVPDSLTPLLRRIGWGGTLSLYESITDGMPG